MKQRALPQSFWQQPNVANPQPPGVVCSALPALPLGAAGAGGGGAGDDGSVDITPVEEVASQLQLNDSMAGAGATAAASTPANSVRTKIISAANTDLLFSLFNVVEEEEVQRRIHVVKRGRWVGRCAVHMVERNNRFFEREFLDRKLRFYTAHE